MNELEAMGQRVEESGEAPDNLKISKVNNNSNTGSACSHVMSKCHEPTSHHIQSITTHTPRFRQHALLSACGFNVISGWYGRRACYQTSSQQPVFRVVLKTTSWSSRSVLRCTNLPTFSTTSFCSFSSWESESTWSSRTWTCSLLLRLLADSCARVSCIWPKSSVTCAAVNTSIPRYSTNMAQRWEEKSYHTTHLNNTGSISTFHQNIVQHTASMPHFSYASKLTFKIIYSTVRPSSYPT